MDTLRDHVIGITILFAIGAFILASTYAFVSLGWITYG